MCCPQRQGVLPVEGEPREAGRAVRVHPVRVLLHLVPLLLVEPRQVPGPRGAAGLLQVRVCLFSGCVDVWRYFQAYLLVVWHLSDVLDGVEFGE